MSHEQRVEAGRIGGKVGGVRTGKSGKSGWKTGAAGRAGGKRAGALNHTGMQTLSTCPHCGKIGKTAPMGRWHFDNCPKKSGVK